MGRGDKGGGNRGGSHNMKHHHKRNGNIQNNGNSNNNNKNKSSKNVHKNANAQKRFMSALLVAGLGPKNNENDGQVHQRLVNQANGLVEVFKVQCHLRLKGSDNPLWETILGIKKDFCSFCHPVGITDGDGDSAMGDGSFCKCRSDDRNIPDCFLRGFYYLLLVCEERAKADGQ